MNIIHITWGLGVGGIETMLVNISNCQSDDNVVSVIVINNNVDEGLANSLNPKIRLYRLNRSKGSTSLISYVKLNILLFKLSPDIIHLHYANIAKIIPIFKNKLVVTMHDVCNGYNSCNLYRSKKIFAISNIVKKDIFQKEHLKSTVILNGIRPEKFYTRERKDERLFRIVQVSRLLHEKKGQHILIKAMYFLTNWGIDNIYLDFIGEGPSEQYLKRLVDEFQLSDKIHFCGVKDQNYIQQHLCEYDLFVQASLFEGFGLTVAEAMAAKVPVLVSENQGPLEIIDYGNFGYSFKNGDAEDCALQIKKIIDEGIDYTKVEKAYQRVFSVYNVRNTAKQYICEYNKVRC